VPIVSLLALLATQIPDLEAAVKRHATAAGVRQLADAYVVAEEFSKASTNFDRAAEMYRKMGDPNAGKVLEGYAGRYRTTIGIYVDKPVEPANPATLGKFEPAAGCYLGANIEREDETRDPAEFNQRIDRHHAMFFMYRKYGVDFPTEYAQQLKEAGCALQLAFEPGDLSGVEDNDYLHRFAQDAKESGIPVFLRYASEMNGAWTPYHVNPKLYVEKFQLVAKVMHDEAPNVAMVWCPNEMPQQPIPDYFPGDDAVDWVGVNFYSVIYNDADATRNAEWRHPEDALDYIYKTYSPKHPIMVGEWAATHRSKVDNKERPDFATTKIGQFYGAIPRIYPRVKAVSWLSFDTFKYAEGDRQLNDYSLFSNPAVPGPYTAAISEPYYLPQIDQDGSKTAPMPLADGTRLSTSSVVSTYVRSYDSAPKITVLLDKTPIAWASLPGTIRFCMPSTAKEGYHTLTVEARDQKGHLAGNHTVPIFVSGT